jgi:hypothetical protein
MARPFLTGCRQQHPGLFSKSMGSTSQHSRNGFGSEVVKLVSCGWLPGNSDTMVFIFIASWSFRANAFERSGLRFWTARYINTASTLTVKRLLYRKV